jgi:hypothetical protein
MWSVLVILSALATSATCEIPDDYRNRVVVDQDSLRVGFATPRLLQRPGEPVSFFLIITNISSRPIHIFTGQGPMNMVAVLPEECTSLEEPGCFWPAVFFYPTLVNFFGDGAHLEPGECVIRVVEWDGMMYGGIPPDKGMYNVIGGVFHHHLLPEIFIPVGGAKLKLGLLDLPTPSERATWGMIRTRYK